MHCHGVDYLPINITILAVTIKLTHLNEIAVLVVRIVCEQVLSFSSLGLPLGLEAPVITPVGFLFCFHPLGMGCKSKLICKDLSECTLSWNRHCTTGAHSAYAANK